MPIIQHLLRECYNSFMSGRRKDYYPSYYRDKRRREQAVLAISTIILGVLVLGLIALALVYFIKPRENLEQLAQRRDEIVQPSVPATGPAPSQVPTPEEENLLKTEDITDVGSSVPEMSLAPVQLAGVEPAADQPPPPQMTPEQSAGGEGAETASELPADESATPVKSDESKAGASAEKPNADQAKPEAKKEEKPKEKPKDKPAPKKETPKKPTPKKETKPSEPVYRYNVFAGTYDSESEANQQREHLIEMGLQSSVSARGAGDAKTYVVAVGSSLDTYEQALALKNKLREAGFGSSYILRREAQ